MSETDQTEPSEPTDGGTVAEPTKRRGERFRTAVNYLVLAGLGLTMLVAGIQFYASADAAISRFVAREFRPVVRAVFNLGLAVLAAAGVSIQLSRLR